jgi:hypothetical protein
LFQDDEFCEIEFLPEEIVNAIIELVDSAVGNYSAGSPAAQLAMNWLIQFNGISMTSHIEKGSRLVIRRITKSKIIVLILGKRSEYKNIGKEGIANTCLVPQRRLGISALGQRLRDR